MSISVEQHHPEQIKPPAAEEFQQNYKFNNLRIIKRKSKKRKVQSQKPAWDSQFGIVASRDNHHQHQYYRQYFDKQPKEHAFNFRFKYAMNSLETAGIVQMHEKEKPYSSLNYRERFQYHKVPHSTGMNLKLKANLRQPIDRSQAYPDLYKHLTKAGGWNDSTLVDCKYTRSQKKILKVGEHLNSQRTFYSQVSTSQVADSIQHIQDRINDKYFQMKDEQSFCYGTGNNVSQNKTSRPAS